MNHNLSLNDVTITLRDDVLYTLTLTNEKTKLVLVDNGEVDYNEVAKILESYLDFSFGEILELFTKVESGLPILLESQNVNMAPYKVQLVKKDVRIQTYDITLIDMVSEEAIMDGEVANAAAVEAALKKYYGMGERSIAMFFQGMKNGLPANIRAYSWHNAPYSISVQKRSLV